MVHMPRNEYAVRQTSVVSVCFTITAPVSDRLRASLALAFLGLGLALPGLGLGLVAL